jgi:bifunctional DNA-binding transcriptional regulator/antitoxin component of YhaV-PrlF toxin-antitoxin module
MRIVESNNQYRITIPKDLIEEKGWDAGTKLRFVEDMNGNVFLKEISRKKRGNNEKR